MIFKFLCYFPSEDIFFTLNIDLDEHIDDVLEAIQTKLISRAHSQKIAVRDLKLYHSNIDKDPIDGRQTHVLQWLRTPPKSNHLQNPEKLIHYFPNGLGPDNHELNIIVVNPDALDLLDPAEASKRKLKEDLDQRLNRLSPFDSPSYIVHHSDKLAEQFGGDETLVNLGRPGGAPAALYNQALASLQIHLENLDEVHIAPLEVRRAATYLEFAVKFYNDEAERKHAMKGLLDQVIGEKGVWGNPIKWADNIKPDGSWWHDLFLFLVLELKNNLGLSGDALLQAVLDYTKVVSREKFKPYREYCNFPVVLVGVTANRIEISVAVWIGSVNVSKLFSSDFALGANGSKNIIRLARVFKALSLCCEELKTYYNDIPSMTSPRLSCLFPTPTLEDSTDPTALLSFQEFLSQLSFQKFLSRTGEPTSTLPDLASTITFLYSAVLQVTNTKRKVIVKFTTDYNEKAHRLLADAGFAPKLHFCARVVGDLYMVVMDHVEGGKSILQLQHDKAPIPRVVAEKVKEALKILHGQKIVFGDLRYPNILYVKSQNGVSLVDFDWAATDGEGRYPATLNPMNRWADDVWGFGIMHKAHDLWQLKQLETICTSTV